MKEENPLISVIVTTRNNTATLDRCLCSIKSQTYQPIELIVVDNGSTDDTKEIAWIYTDKVYDKGPERSAQRNFAASEALGSHILIIDSDMELDEAVVQACVDTVRKKPKLKALIIPEESFGEGFWARCKQLERSFYVGQDAIEAARFFEKSLYQKLGGYNEAMTGGEDWDLTNRVRQHTEVGRVKPFIRHNEGRLNFTRTMRKMYYYARHAQTYFAANADQSALTNQSGPLARYKLFFSRPGKLFKNPVLGIGMLTLKTAEYASAAAGMATTRLNKKEQANG